MMGNGELTEMPNLSAMNQETLNPFRANYYAA
jgi:hypothetical protein